MGVGLENTLPEVGFKISATLERGRGKGHGLGDKGPGGDHNVFMKVATVVLF